MSYGFRFVLLDEERVPLDPAVFVTAAPNWKEGETLLLANGERYRILKIETEISADAEAKGINGVFIVEPT